MADNKRVSVSNMTATQIIRYVKEQARNDDNIVLTRHTRWDRMGKRRIGPADIARVLRLGRMIREPEPGKNYPNEIKCRFQHTDHDLKSISVEVAISDDDPSLIIITVIRHA
jgi:hypothetical protein